MRKLEIKIEEFPLKKQFTIAHESRNISQVIRVIIKDQNNIGQGECFPYIRYKEDVNSVIKQIENLRKDIEAGINRKQLQQRLKAGAARNAIDIALWDLEAKRNNIPMWELAGLNILESVQIPMTLSIDDPINMKNLALEAQEYKILKLKMAGDGKDMERVKNVRETRPDARIVIDANESWNLDDYHKNINFCVSQNVELIEQPFKSNEDNYLNQIPRPIPICADESCHVSDDLRNLVNKYDMVNIKLDKSGGLTEAIKLMKLAKEMGFKIMIGCMTATSLAIRPAFFLAQYADFCDLDGPALLAKDRNDKMIYKDGRIFMA